jgi:hypothetical protein
MDSHDSHLVLHFLRWLLSTPCNGFRVKEKTKWHRIDKDLIYDILAWRCAGNGDSECPAIVFEDDKAYLLKLDGNEERYVKVLDFERVLIEEIEGIKRYSDCLARYGYDYPC